MNLLERVVQINLELTEKKEPEKLRYTYKGKNVTSTIFTAQGQWMAKNKILAPDGSIEKAWNTTAGDKASLRKYIKNDIEAVLSGKEPLGGKKKPGTRSGDAPVPSGRRSVREPESPVAEQIQLWQMMDKANKDTKAGFGDFGSMLADKYFKAFKKMVAFFKRSSRSDAIRRVYTRPSTPNIIYVIPVGNRTREYEVENIGLSDDSITYRATKQYLADFIDNLANEGYGAWGVQNNSGYFGYDNASL
jgi:hypothetical protein